LRTLIRTSFWIQRLTGETIQLLHTKSGTQTGENVFIPTISLEKALNAVESCVIVINWDVLLTRVVVTDDRRVAITYQYLIPN